MRTLALKLVLAFLLVSVTVSILGSLAVRWRTNQEFKQLVLEQTQSRFIADMATYYQFRGSWAGVMEYLGRRPLIQPLPPVEPPPVINPADTSKKPQNFVFALADQAGKVVIPAGPYRPGYQLTDGEMNSAETVIVNDQVVGYVIATGEPPPLDPREVRYLKRTDQALFLAGLGALGIALILGIWLARTLTRPLHELTAATRRMAQGQLEQKVPVTSQDELGKLADSFNQMSARLAYANQLRRQMTADIAHDLRSPLTVIGGYMEAMRDGVLKPSPERFDTVHQEVIHLQRLVEDLRTLSLADAGELTLNRQPTSPQALLERLAASYQHRAGQKDILLQVEPAPTLPEIHVDPERMAQVLGNLLSNALRYTPTGGKITLSAGRQNDHVNIRVSDTGQGISPEALPHIFDRFYRADPSRQQAEGETGLGLAIARSLVEAHGGAIVADSAPSKGTTFTITLPISK